MTKAAKLLDRVPQDDEIKSREKMRKHGQAIATMQGQIVEQIARMKKSDPSIDNTDLVQAEADEGVGKALRASCNAGAQMEDCCY